jgi:hypothetical protein
MIVLLTITVDSRGARVSFIRYVPIWVRHPDFVVLPAGTAWRSDPADAAALRASYERTVAAAGRGPRIQPIPAHLLSAAWPAPRITSQRTGRQRKRIAPGVRGASPPGLGRRLVTDGDSTAVVRHAISAVLYWNNPFGTGRSRHTERHFLSRWLSWGECAAKFSAWSRQI